MKFVVSTLSRVMYFSHDGNILTIDQLSFVKTSHRMNPSHHTSLNVPRVLVVPSPSPAMSLTFEHHDEVESFENHSFFSS